MTRNTPRTATATAHAKINIGWQVGRLRDDGYHDVAGLIQTISLHDKLDFNVGETGGVILRVPGASELETEDNLVMKAARVLGERVESRPTTITLHKSIPIAAGLGGGSADAAATLVALNVLWGARRTAGQLIEMGAEVGADVPALLLGGLVHVSGRGERVRNVGSADSGVFVLGLSSERISAADAYKAFDTIGPSDREMVGNDLERACIELVPDLEKRLQAMRDVCSVAFVTGSGPTVVGLAPDESSARDAAKRVESHFAAVHVAAPTDHSVRLKVWR